MTVCRFNWELSVLSFNTRHTLDPANDISPPNRAKAIASVTSCFKPLLLFFIFSALQIIILTGTAKDVRSEPIRKVLILHSYHQGLMWTDNVNKGLRSVFGPLEGQFGLYFEYLDVKRRPSRISNPSLDYDLKKYFHDKCQLIAFDAVIVSDNEAFNWLVTSGLPNHQQLPVVFCGVTHQAWESAVVDFPVTGVIHSIDHAANFKLMFKLHPQCKRVIFLFDWASNHNARQALNEIMKTKPTHVTVDTWPDPSLDGLPVRLQSLDANDLIYLLVVNRDKQLTYLNSNEGIDTVARWSAGACL